MAGEKQYFVLLNVCFGLDAHAEKLLLQKRFGIFRINLKSKACLLGFVGC